MMSYMMDSCRYLIIILLSTMQGKVSEMKPGASESEEKGFEEAVCIIADVFLEMELIQCR